MLGHRSEIASIELSPNGHEALTASADGTARIWNLSFLARFPEKSDFDPARFAPSASFNRDGTMVTVAGNSRTAVVTSLAAKRPPVTLAGHTARVLYSEFSHRGDRVVTSAEDGTARIWDAQSGNCLLILPAYEGNGEEVEVFEARFSPDDRYVVTVGSDATGRIWDASSGRQLSILRGHSSDGVAEWAGWVTQAVFSPDGSSVATGGADAAVIVWDVPGGRIQHRLAGHTDYITDLGFTADGSKLLSGSIDRTARLWDLGTGTPLTVFAGHRQQVVSARLSADGGRVITASMDQSARIWDANTGAALLVLWGHTTQLTEAAFDASGRWVVTASDADTGSATIRVWNSTTGHGVAEWLLPEGNAQALFSPTQSAVVTFTGNGTVQIRPCQLCVELPELQAAGCSQITRNMTVAEWNAFVGGSRQKTCSAFE